MSRLLPAGGFTILRLAHIPNTPTSQVTTVSLVLVAGSPRDVRILCAHNFAENQPPCAEVGVLHTIEENLPNGAENSKMLLIFVNPFTYNG